MEESLSRRNVKQARVLLPEGQSDPGEYLEEYGFSIEPCFTGKQPKHTNAGEEADSGFKTKRYVFGGSLSEESEMIDGKITTTKQPKHNNVGEEADSGFKTKKYVFGN